MSMTPKEYIELRSGGYYVKATRVPLDSIVYEFRNGASPETIRQTFPTLTLEQVYGAITFYLGHQEQVDATIKDAERVWAEFGATHPLPDGLRDRLHAGLGRTARRRDR